MPPRSARSPRRSGSRSSRSFDRLPWRRLGRWLIPLVALLTASLGIAACSGGGGDAAVPISTVAPEPTSTEPPAPTSSTTASTIPVPSGPIAPLTGLVESVTPLGRPALAVKIDNHRDSRPPAGIDLADLVLESRAEGVTRFMAVFHSMTPSVLGPVRSSRTTDFNLLTALDTPLYGSSGGNAAVLRGLRGLPIYALTAMSENVYYRARGRLGPHNLFVDANDLFALAPADATPPEPWFTYRSADAALGSSARALSGEITVSFRNSPIVGFIWDDALSGWARSQDGQPHVTEAGERIAPANVVVMVADYRRSSADPNSPELVSTGEGELYVLTAGAMIEGTWTRERASDKPTLIDSTGQPILLTPGQTWILFPEGAPEETPSGQ